jgi:hypothetical protein
MSAPHLAGSRARVGAVLLVAACAAGAVVQTARPARADAADRPPITCAIDGSFTASPGVTTTSGTDSASGTGTSIICFAARGHASAPRAARVSTSGALTGTCASISGTLKTTITWTMTDGAPRTSVLDWTLHPGSSMIAATGGGTIEPGGFLAGHHVTVSIADASGSTRDCAAGDPDTGQSDRGILTIH